MPFPNEAAAAEPDLGEFIKLLAEEGRAVVSARPLKTDEPNALAALAQIDELARAGFGLEAPLFSNEAALWAARLFYHLCQFTVCRDIGEEQIRVQCTIPCPAPRGPAIDWSADLSLRHLPKVFELARHTSSGDPLVQQLKVIATEWPLSSVGIPGLNNPRIDSFIGHPTLRRLYVDRIIACGDVSRLGNASVDDTLRADLGVHRDLAPMLAQKLFQNHDSN
jgi:MoxR-vWA-beta-propeller ternary system domain bpX4